MSMIECRAEDWATWVSVLFTGAASIGASVYAEVRYMGFHRQRPWRVECEHSDGLRTRGAVRTFRARDEAAAFAAGHVRRALPALERACGVES